MKFLKKILEIQHTKFPIPLKFYQYLTSKKNVWNNRHNIKIFGHDVEIYPQDAEEVHHSTGIYSVMWDRWNLKPKLTKHYIDHKKIKRK